MDITITATNPRPTATGTEGGVDVDFRLDIDGEFELAGEVTLLQNERGNYSSWGELAHWLDGESLRVLREERFDDAFSRITSEIAAECGDAAGRAYPDGVEADDAGEDGVKYEVIYTADTDGNWCSQCAGVLYDTREEADAALAADETARPDAYGNKCHPEIVEVRGRA